MNIIIRECLDCKAFGKEENYFKYCYPLASIWRCINCGSKHTQIKEIIEKE